jgi:hypothetical protein
MASAAEAMAAQEIPPILSRDVQEGAAVSYTVTNMNGNFISYVLE